MRLLKSLTRIVFKYEGTDPNSPKGKWSHKNNNRFAVNVDDIKLISANDDNSFTSIIVGNLHYEVEESYETVLQLIDDLNKPFQHNRRSSLPGPESYVDDNPKTTITDVGLAAIEEAERILRREYVAYDCFNRVLGTFYAHTSEEAARLSKFRYPQSTWFRPFLPTEDQTLMRGTKYVPAFGRR